MTVLLYNFIRKMLSPLWLTGPIFDKELRVSSRRRRNYVLRFAYVGILTVFLALVWIEAMGQSGSAVYRISRMAEAGKFVIIYMIWFQFCTTQVLAVILLSNSISDEIYNRTLGLLMTTPINSFQIVMGKLFSKLLQLVLLLAISLPLLAIIRVLGGVPWNYVISSLCITLTTIIFVGSLSLFFSIFSRRTYVVIIVTIITLGTIFALLPLGLYAVWDIMNSTISERSVFTMIFLPNPYCGMFFNTIAMVNPRSAAALTFYSWPLHCGIMLAVSALLLFVSMILVRKVALRQATGQLDSSSGKHRSAKGKAANQRVFTGAVRRVIGPPIIWKELRSPILGRHKIRSCILVFIGLILLIGSYYLCAIVGTLDGEETHVTYAIIFLGVGMLFTIILPATSITTERESRSWPVLLATPLDDKDILLGKFIGALRRCFPAWLLLFGHIITFSLLGFIHPLAIIQTGILVTWIAVFLCSSGLYFSSRFKHTTTAVLMNFALIATIWAILPLLMAIIGSINTPLTHETRELVEAYVDTNPFVHMVNIMIATAGEEPYKIGRYSWPGQGRLNAVESTFLMLVCMISYIMISFLFAWRAKCQFRRKIF
ncbi:MAG: ABC transporter permease [Planctomycetota bacterium]|jgi:ABC-type transport system involved in multi-copper enzyme maturation permease subunit